MAAQKKKETDLPELDTAQASGSRYDTSGLESRKEVEEALAGASYQPSQTVNDAAEALKQWQNSRPEEYKSGYQNQIDSLLRQLLGRESFAYHYQEDPLYRQYAQAYTQNAANASADAAAQAAALTGGYGSSYAASVAQQAYQQQMNGLNSAIPTLYQLALDTYNSGGDDLLTRIDQLNAQEQNAQSLYDRELSDYYTQLEQKGNAYNTAYAQDYSQYQDYLDRLDALHGYYSTQEQTVAAQKQQRFNNAVTVLGLIGDAVQLLLSGTAGLGSMAGSLLNTGYKIYSGDRAYEAERADAAWSQKMQEQQRQDGLTQQQYKNEQAQRQYEDSLAQQKFNNEVTAQKLNIAKGEWALKQSKAAQSAAKAGAAAAAKQSGTTEGASLGGGSLTMGKGSVYSGTTIPYEAARLRSQGRSDSAIRTELLKSGYTEAQVSAIWKQMNR